MYVLSLIVRARGEDACMCGVAASAQSSCDPAKVPCVVALDHAAPDSRASVPVFFSCKMNAETITAATKQNKIGDTRSKKQQRLER